MDTLSKTRLVATVIGPGGGAGGGGGPGGGGEFAVVLVPPPQDDRSINAETATAVLILANGVCISWYVSLTL